MNQPLRIGHMGPRNGAYQAAVEEIAADLHQNGCFPGAELFPEGTLGDETAMLTQVLSGDLQIMVATSSSVGRLCPETYLCDLPFLFSNRPHFYAAVDTVLKPVFSRLFAEKGLRLLAVFEGGWRDLYNSRHPICSTADLSGLTMRTMDNPIHQRTMEVLGARPVVLSTKESFTALAAGILDGGDRAASNYVDYGYDKVAPYYTSIGIFMIASYLVAPEKWFTALAPAEQGAVLAAAAAAERMERSWYARADAQALASLASRGVTVTTADRRAFAQTTRCVWSEFQSRTPVADLLEHIQQLA